jgi:hypothetical protein
VNRLIHEPVGDPRINGQLRRHTPVAFAEISPGSLLENDPGRDTRLPPPRVNEVRSSNAVEKPRVHF